MYYLCNFAATLMCFVIKMLWMLISLAKDIKTTLMIMNLSEESDDCGWERSRYVIEFIQQHSNSIQLRELFLKNCENPFITETQFLMELFNFVHNDLI